MMKPVRSFIGQIVSNAHANDDEYCKSYLTRYPSFQAGTHSAPVSRVRGPLCWRKSSPGFIPHPSTAVRTGRSILPGLPGRENHRSQTPSLQFSMTLARAPRSSSTGNSMIAIILAKSFPLSPASLPCVIIASEMLSLVRSGRANH